MKSSVLLVAVIGFVCVATVMAVTDGGWSAWTECSRPCDGGLQFRDCNNPVPTTGTCDGQNTQVCNNQACKNCTVSGWSNYNKCTKTCASGTQYRTRTVTQYPSNGLTPPGPGGTDCPVLNQTAVCNTQLCTATLVAMGYVYWGPLKGPGPLSYTVRRLNTEVDVFVFNQANFFQYQFDAARTTPLETGYTSVMASLDVDNSNEVVTLDSTSKWFLVVDHTLIGAAQGTNQNGQQVFNTNPFAFAINGLELPAPVFVYPMGTNGATTATPAVFTLVAAMMAVIALLR